MLENKLSKIISVLSLALISTAACAHGSHHSTVPYKDSDYKGAEYKGMLSVDPQPQFEVEFLPMLLKAGTSNLNYAIYNNELPVQSPSWAEQQLRPGYSFAFELGGRYLFPAGHDISLYWTHLNSHTSSSVLSPNINFFVGPDYEIGPPALDVRDANGYVRFRYDVINLDAGHKINLDEHVSIRLFGGLSNGYLREQITSNYSGATTGVFAGNFNMRQQVTANFTGIGPRMGVGATFASDCGLSFYGEGAAAALIGSSYSKTTFNGRSAELLALFAQPLNSQYISDQNITQVIPGFDSKIGVDYSYKFAHNVLATVGAGYQASVYINAINQFLPGTLVQPAVGDTSIASGGIFVNTMNHTQSNYSVQGPFLKFAVSF